jgi:hypothetical protein
MQTDLRSIVESIEGALVGAELIHDSVDMAFTGADPNELTDDFSNVLLVTNLVHTRLMQVAEEVDIVAILFTNAHVPPDKVKKRAAELEIDLITTKLTLEEVGRRLKAEYGPTLDVKAHIQPHSDPH